LTTQNPRRREGLDLKNVNSSDWRYKERGGVTKKNTKRNPGSERQGEGEWEGIGVNGKGKLRAVSFNQQINGSTRRHAPKGHMSDVLCWKITGGTKMRTHIEAGISVERGGGTK